MTIVWEIITTFELILLVFLIYFIQRRYDKELKELKKLIDSHHPNIEQEIDQEQPFVCPECKVNDELILVSQERGMWYCDTCKKMIKKV